MELGIGGSSPFNDQVDNSKPIDLTNQTLHLNHQMILRERNLSSMLKLFLCNYGDQRDLTTLNRLDGVR